MLVCIPITEDRGLESPTSGHFGSTPFFLLVDTDTRACRAIANGNRNHGPGPCNPLVSLQGERIDHVLVRGIGGGALDRLHAVGAQVHATGHATAAEALAAFEAGERTAVGETRPCGHDHDHDHGHEHTPHR